MPKTLQYDEIGPLPITDDAAATAIAWAVHGVFEAESKMLEVLEAAGLADPHGRTMRGILRAVMAAAVRVTYDDRDREDFRFDEETARDTAKRLLSLERGIRNFRKGDDRPDRMPY